MATLPPIDGLERLSDETLHTLRQRLVEGGYNGAAIDEGEAIAPKMLDALRLPLLRHIWLSAPTRAHDLALIFSYETAVPEGRVRDALGGDLVDALVTAGFLSREDDALRTQFRIMPLDPLLIVSDDLHRDSEAVMGPGPTTMQISSPISGEVKGRVLDIGCGAGTLSLVAASRGASEVIGVDISERAVSLGRLNARFNNLKARFEVSDLFSAVEGERFDLIVSQPAFIARPPDVEASTFAHGGPMGDELVIRLFEELAAHLAPGGRALVLLESAVRPKSPLHARLRAALGDAPVDLLVLAARGLPIDAYSYAYASLVDGALGDVWQRATMRYYDHLKAMGVTEFAVALAMVTTKEGNDSGYTITVPVKRLHGFDSDAMREITRALALAMRRDSEIEAATVRAAPNALYVEERKRPDSSLEPRWVVRFQRPEWSDRELTEATWVLLGQLDGADTVGAAIAAYAEACGASVDEVRSQVLGFVRESLARGLLVAR